jgi:hypothetical protein
LEYGLVKIQGQNSGNTVGTHNDRATAAFVPSVFNGSQDLGNLGRGMPSTDLQLPTVTRESEIISVLNAPATKGQGRKNDKSQKDLINIALRDGTSIHLTLFQYLRINSKKRLEPGTKIRVTFQRNPSDTGSEPSKIISVD